MHSLKVRCHEVRITPGHLQRGVPENLLQVEDATAPSKIVDRESVSETMQGPGGRVKAEVFTEELHPA